MKNITFSAPGELIEEARKDAKAKGTTLNQEFRDWLELRTVSGEERLAQYKQLMKRLSHVNAGHKFMREEMNKR
ncbi:MAG TPA: hypothetical protein VNG32_03000 [Candidatus Dormibacteraeota bacterium]|nr:hypothetical protein [Candidatus Dormibacteraeota bacterium]